MKEKYKELLEAIQDLRKESNTTESQIFKEF